jgi:hypothetical protein
MKKPIEIQKIFRCTDFDMANMEELEEWHWLSKTQCAQRWAIKGVATSTIDFYIVDRLYNCSIPEDHVQIIELSKKKGKYDHTERDHVCVRFVPAHQAPTQCISVSIDATDTNAFLIVGEKRYTYFRFRKFEVKNPDHLEGIVRWHFDRYYRFLNDCDIKSVVSQLEEYLSNNVDITLAALNRVASRLLYRCARENGFRKLTKREQLRLRLSGQWHTEAQYADAQNKIQCSYYSPTGESEYSLRESKGLI